MKLLKASVESGPVLNTSTKAAEEDLSLCRGPNLAWRLSMNCFPRFAITNSATAEVIRGNNGTVLHKCRKNEQN